MTDLNRKRPNSDIGDRQLTSSVRGAHRTEERTSSRLSDLNRDVSCDGSVGESQGVLNLPAADELEVLSNLLAGSDSDIRRACYIRSGIRSSHDCRPQAEIGQLVTPVWGSRRTPLE